MGNTSEAVTIRSRPYALRSLLKLMPQTWLSNDDHHDTRSAWLSLSLSLSAVAYCEARVAEQSREASAIQLNNNSTISR